uniref:EGF-like domain-containing protein n=1 Tax=Plectus sambesii TaxID=2011161 RepID=A0A914VWG5_9BILA
MLFVGLAVAYFCITLLSPVWARPTSRVPDHCGPRNCSGHGICQTFFNSSSRREEKKCKCSDGFIGDHCQMEGILSRRCYSRVDESNQKNQIPGIEGCPDGQFCMPDNFYCLYYDCPNSIGWCLKIPTISVNAVSSQMTTSENVPSTDTEKTYNEELFGTGKIPDDEEDERSADDD